MTDDRDRLEERSQFGRALARSGYENVSILGLEEAAELLTEERRAIIHVLRGGDYESVSELASDLDRDVDTVSRDLTVLAEHGVTTLEDTGSANRPVLRAGTIVNEPVVVSQE